MAELRSFIYCRKMMDHKRYLETVWRMFTSHLLLSIQLCQLKIRLTRMIGNTMQRWLLKLVSKSKLSAMIFSSQIQRQADVTIITVMYQIMWWMLENMSWRFFIHYAAAASGESNQWEDLQCPSFEGSTPCSFRVALMLLLCILRIVTVYRFLWIISE